VDNALKMEASPFQRIKFLKGFLIMYVIVGLGNPGKKYENTKHNVGFWVIDTLAEKMGISLDKKNCSAISGTGIYQGKKVLLAKPQTYMNLSGEAVIQLLNYYDNLDELLIIHDDLDLAEGVIRFKEGGGLAGHNGLKSIAHHLHSNDFDRLRVGIGRPEFQKVVNYVLEPFEKEKQELLDEMEWKVLCVESLVCGKFFEGMSPKVFKTFFSSMR
jgi:PTH1 family peptidyl-tRNA hydrolase